MLYLIVSGWWDGYAPLPNGQRPVCVTVLFYRFFGVSLFLLLFRGTYE